MWQKSSAYTASIPYPSGWAHDARGIAFVLRDDKGAALVHHLRRFGEQMLLGVVEDGVRRIEAQAIDMKLVEPVRGVREEERPHRRSVRPSKFSAAPHGV